MSPARARQFLESSPGAAAQATTVRSVRGRTPQSDFATLSRRHTARWAPPLHVRPRARRGRRATADYAPRRPEETPLYRVLQRHLATFLDKDSLEGEVLLERDDQSRLAELVRR